MGSFSPTDLQTLARRGISEEEAARQLRVLRRPPTWTRLERPCKVGDGIRHIEPSEHVVLLREHRRAADAGRFTKFVPASGAATRMFRELLYYQRGPGRGETPRPGAESAAVLEQFVSGLERFAFFPELARTVASRGHDALALAAEGSFQPLLDALLDSEGMDYDDLPKGRLLFHHGDDGPRTSFEEHLVEAARYVRRSDSTCRLHFTVSEEHREGFEELLARVGPRWAERLGTRWDVGWSHQEPSTDTLAVDRDGEPVRDDTGQLLFRPGGHGALIENIGRLGGDLVYVKNIDNVQPEHAREATVLWKRLLGGLLAQTEQRVHALLAALESNHGVDEARAFATEVLAVDVPDGDPRSALIDLLARPLRIAGVVRNTGEPGGGPFWVRGGDGRVSAQIVETAQVDPGDAGQQAILRTSTHFNPVDLVCAVRDADHNAFDLAAYIDESTAIVTSKSIDGRDIRALERPGLWNGAMAGWNTIFVEVPLETFTPVKSVLDLLRPEHQPPA